MLTLVGNASNGIWETHKDGCRDIQKAKRKMGLDAEVTAGFDNVDQILDYVFGDLIDDEPEFAESYRQDLNVKPCANH